MNEPLWKHILSYILLSITIISIFSIMYNIDIQNYSRLYYLIPIFIISLAFTLKLFNDLMSLPKISYNPYGGGR